MALRIVVAGEIYLDQVLAGFAAWPQPGEEAFAASLTREAGGGAPHAAAGLARLGWDVTLVGPVGNDPWLRARLEQLGLRTQALHEHASEPTGTTVAVSMPGERTFFTYRGANADVEAALRSVPEADHLHIAAACDSELLGWLLYAHQDCLGRRRLASGVAARRIRPSGEAGCVVVFSE